MDLREIRYFAQVARAGSFSRAASELRIAQPALSRKVRQLEQELGVDLLVRHGRGVRLTEAGATFLEDAEAIDKLVRETGARARTQGVAPAGHVALGVPPAAGLRLVPPLIARFREDWPQVSLHVREGISSSLQEWLLDRRIDVAVLYNPPPLDAFETTPILADRVVVIGPGGRRGARERGRDSFRIRDLAGLPLIMPSLPHNNRRVLEQAAQHHGVRLDIVLEVDSVVLTRRLVGRGLGYSVIAFSAVADEVARGEIRAYPIERPPLVSTLAVATLRDVQAAPHTRDLIAKIRTTVRDLVRAGEWQGGRLKG